MSELPATRQWERYMPPSEVFSRNMHDEATAMHDELLARIAELEAENKAMQEWREGWDGVCQRCPRSRAEASLAQRDRMLDEFTRNLELLRVGEGVGVERQIGNNLCLNHVQAMLADLRARAEEGSAS